MEIQTLKTAVGEAWLVESTQIPMVSVLLSFRAGAAFEPANKSGLASYTATLLEETGAGDYNAQAFKEEFEKIGAQVSVSASRLNMTVELTTLSEHLPRAMALVGLMLTQSRFDAADGVRVREALYSSLKQSLEDPSRVAARAFTKALYGQHPYGQLIAGELETLAQMTAADAAAFAQAQLTRANLKISAVGDVTGPALVQLINQHLAKLPQGEGRNLIAEAPKAPPAQVQFAQREVPQGAVYLGHLGTDLRNPDRYALIVMNYLLGGGGFSSRLMDEIREKRGLVYGVYSSFDYLPQRGAFTVVLQTKNESIDQAIGLVKEQIRLLQAKGVTESEFQDALDYLLGSFPMRLDTNSKILDNLDLIQNEELGKDYLTQWPAKIRAVTRADVQRVAQQYLQPDRMVISIVAGEKPALAR